MANKKFKAYIVGWHALGGVCDHINQIGYNIILHQGKWILKAERVWSEPCKPMAHVFHNLAGVKADYQTLISRLHDKLEFSRTHTLHALQPL